MATPVERKLQARGALTLLGEGVHPFLARLLAARGIGSRADIGGTLGKLHHHSTLKGAQQAAEFLADAIAAGKPLLVVADYDCDGATACATAVRGLRAFGATVEYIVPDRMLHGYGLTKSVVDLAVARFPQTQVLVTVDNGVASHEGVERAVALGLDVVVTDHHLPSKLKALPCASVIVDPAQTGCEFPSKNLAGVGVIWYVLWALQDVLRARGVDFGSFKVSQLLSLIAIGTVADVVVLDQNNRILVTAGIERIRQGQSYPGIEALALAGKFNKTRLAMLRTSDIAFGLGPRINAAGRLGSMDLGINCLLTDDLDEAQNLAQTLDEVNQKRKDVEFKIVVSATEQADALVEEGTKSIVVSQVGWHAGVIGIVAGRIKEKRNRPTFVLTENADTGELKGSGRSIMGFNLKDALDQVDKANPGLMPKFGGHSMAAGVSLRAGGFAAFKASFEAESDRLLDEKLLLQMLEHDGALTSQELAPVTCFLLGDVPWGQGFLEPSFCNTFALESAKIAGVRKDQLNMVVNFEGVSLRATKFRHEEALPCGHVTLVYKLTVVHDKWGKPELKLLVDHVS